MQRTSVSLVAPSPVAPRLPQRRQCNSIEYVSFHSCELAFISEIYPGRHVRPLARHCMATPRRRNVATRRLLAKCTVMPHNSVAWTLLKFLGDAFSSDVAWPYAEVTGRISSHLMRQNHVFSSPHDSGNTSSMNHIMLRGPSLCPVATRHHLRREFDNSDARMHSVETILAVAVCNIERHVPMPQLRALPPTRRQVCNLCSLFSSDPAAA